MFLLIYTKITLFLYEEREAILLHMHPEAAAMLTNPLARLVCRADKLSAAGLVRVSSGENRAG